MPTAPAGCLHVVSPATVLDRICQACDVAWSSDVGLACWSCGGMSARRTVIVPTQPNAFTAAEVELMSR